MRHTENARAYFFFFIYTIAKNITHPRDQCNSKKSSLEKKNVFLFTNDENNWGKNFGHLFAHEKIHHIIIENADN